MENVVKRNENMQIDVDAVQENLAEIRKKLKKEQRQLKIKKFCRNRSALIGTLITGILVILALLAPVICPAGPYDMDVVSRLRAPSFGHIFGTDTFGRDLFARCIYGARISLSVGASVAAISLIVGMCIGLYASYYKTLDNILMRICDGLKALPSILLAIALMAVLGASTKNVILALSIVYIPDVARISRSAALSVKQQTYIESMRALGAKPTRIIWLHIAPNVLSPVIVQASFIFASSIVTEAALSFLGCGVPVPTPSWGNILQEGKTVIYNSWWMIAFPGALTALSVLGLNLLGDGIRDVMDPMSN